MLKSVVTRFGNVPTPEALTLVTLILGFPVKFCATVATPATPA